MVFGKLNIEWKSFLPFTWYGGAMLPIPENSPLAGKGSSEVVKIFYVVLTIHNATTFYHVSAAVLSLVAAFPPFFCCTLTYKCVLQSF
jgi:hypothetical protein